MYTNNRDAYRQTFFSAWQKYQKNLPLEPVEKQIIDVILTHPEYQALLDKQQSHQQEFSIEENPYVHMSLHIALREQLRMNRPRGIKEIYTQLSASHENPHDAEHKMMACLAEMMWIAQQRGQVPTEEEYAEALKKLTE